MKRTVILATAIALVSFSACNNDSAKNEHEGHDMDNQQKESSAHVSPGNDQKIKVVTAQYNNLDPVAAAGIKAIVDQYLNSKNALAADDAKAAASAAEAMEKSMAQLDKSLLTAQQKLSYDALEEQLKVNAAAIAKNAGNIQLQREHFSPLSEMLYLLIKDFGGGRPIYHDHCPMANDNQGAMWISEVKEIKNPYFGAQMYTCGRLEEQIQ